MIAKTESSTFSLLKQTAASHDLDVFDGDLNFSVLQIQEFVTARRVSTSSIFKTVWVLHRHIYEGSTLVKFLELDSTLDGGHTTCYSVDENKSLAQICEDFTLTEVSEPGKYNHVLESCSVLGDHEHYLGKPKTRNGDSTTNGTGYRTFASSLIAVTSFEGNSMRLSILYDSTKFDRRMVIGYWHTFEKILESVIYNAHQAVIIADFLSDHDRGQIVQWNTPIPSKPQDQTICSRFDANVRTNPEAQAIYAWDGVMTYQELDEAASQIALELNSFGVAPGDIVPFCIEKSKWALVAALAILKAGAALVPTDPAWPRQRMIAILEATQASVVICSNETRTCFDQLTVRPFLLSPELALKNGSNASQLCRPSTYDIAFILFSSGSTGVPKGMIREHGTACTGSVAHAKAMHIDSKSRVLQFANHVFDVAMLDFFTTLIVGGCVCIPSEFDRRNDLAAFIRQSEANWVLLTPTVAGMLDPETVPSLSWVHLGGEAITTELLDKWLPHCGVGVNYGSAEVDVTHAQDFHNSRDPTNVGPRLDSCIAYIVHPDNVKKVLPIGAVGELLISAPTMARSYLNQPDRTAASFIPAPVDLLGATKTCPWMSRAYRMGDLLQQQWDGTFRFIGRRDFQVKISGQKVELGEVESHLSTHHLVAKCAVMYPRSGPFADRLIAVVEARDKIAQSRNPSQVLGLQNIKNHLSDKVPSYMLPQIFVLADPMPLTATLKIDRTKLKSWLVEQDPVNASSHVLGSISTALEGPKLSPSDITGFQLSTMIANLVATEGSQSWFTIQGHDNSFSQIGLDSVQIMRLSHLISRTFARKIPVEVLTDQYMTVKRLSQLIDDIPPVNGHSPLSGMTSDDLREKLTHSLSRIHTIRPSACESLNGNNLGLSYLTPGPYNVFLSGATGYLGIQILRALLASPRVGRVYVLVRGMNAVRARFRLVEAAKGANWSIAPFFDRLEIWHGDLSKPQLGLESANWVQLTRSGDQSHKIQSFIHCGAVVDWTKSFDDLEASNVTSTIQLLNAALALPYPAHFTYISGGEYFQPGSDEGTHRLAQRFHIAAVSNGYAQTKFVSEQIIDTVQRDTIGLSNSSLSLRIVKPAYLIGTAQEGLANVNDYLWRMVAAAVRQRAYNGDEDEQWLLAADVGIVAETIAETAIPTTPQSADGCISTKILHGIKVKDFWLIVSSIVGCSLRPVSGVEWLDYVKTTMEGDPEHVLWPLLDAVEQNSGLLTNGSLSAEKMSGTKGVVSIDHIIRKNVEYLTMIGFLPCVG